MSKKIINDGKTIYVFDSYPDGSTAREARAHWGAIPGIPFGPMGHSFAIPLAAWYDPKFYQIFNRKVFEFYVSEFKQYALVNKSLTFFVAPIGGRFPISILTTLVIPRFTESPVCANVVLPEEWKGLLKC
jgi:hypothetical protein